MNEEKKPIEEMSLEELDAVLRAGDAPESTQAEPAPVQAEEVAPEEGAVPEEAQAEEVVPEALDREILESRLAELDAKAKHWEQVAGRNGGELGFLKKQMDDLTKEIASRRSEPGDEYPDLRQEPVAARPISDPVSTWAVHQAINGAAKGFAESHQDFNEMVGDVAEYAKSVNYDPSLLIGSSDPMVAAQETTRFLEEAYWHLRAKKESTRRTELTTKKADQTRLADEAKKKASISGNGSTPAPKSRPKGYEDMNVAELGQELDRLTGGRW